jgi:ABC-type Fe3+/spermidine/putrescine transport system ATPase subunit
VTSGTNGSLTVDTPIGAVGVEAPQSPFSPGDEVALIIRPESIVLGTSDGAAAGHAQWDVTVRTRMFAGSHTEYVVAFENGPVMQVWSPGNHSAGLPGDRVRLTMSPESFHVVARGPETIGQES